MTIDSRAEEWRDRFREEIVRLINEKHARVNDRIDDCEIKHDKLEDHVHADYVKQSTLALYIANIDDRYGPILAAVKWLIGLIVGGFVLALVQYVYTSHK